MSEVVSFSVTVKESLKTEFKNGKREQIIKNKTIRNVVYGKKSVTI